MWYLGAYCLKLKLSFKATQRACAVFDSSSLLADLRWRFQQKHRRNTKEKQPVTFTAEVRRGKCLQRVESKSISNGR